LIFSEGPQISPEGQGYESTPGIPSPEQIAGRKKMTDAMHARGGRSILQFWHVGRASRLYSVILSRCSRRESREHIGHIVRG
jgi:N-ethylmaleimide reductase